MSITPELNIPLYSSRLKVEDGIHFIFDEFRRKWVKLSPEEWVRQQFLMFLVKSLNYPASAIAVEKKLVYNGLTRRPDAVISGPNAALLMVIEFKKTDVVVDEKTFLQAATYISMLKTPYMLISNGLNHYCCYINRENNSISYLSKIPDYQELIDMVS
ncbi:MAG: hypothetical protein CVU11_11375 [Bacteroidetes bacterium HGW-Bacteroidetes-6]|jgi:hypothetical protein|nr:MAG: hypothetical protein CVU11_11375 [Bacteroidetes bacterium HGW-Bacteroidetes-6]